MNKEVYDEDIDNSNPAFESIRQHLNIQVGGLVQNNDVIYRIAQVLDFETVIGTQVESGRSMPLRINDLSPVLGAKSTDNDSTSDISDIADEDWKIAEQRFAVIEPLLNSISPGRHEVEKRAKEAGIDVATLYRWLKKYKAIGVISALIPKKRGWKEGGSRVSASTEEVIESVIKDFYLTSQRQTVAKTVDEVDRCCQLRGIVAPNPSSIRDRLAKITEKESLRGRGFNEKAKNKFMPTPGSFPNADYPLAVIQIDHTPVDIILVDAPGLHWQ
jgi:putative transposase